MRIDERNTMFARMSRKEGTEAYEEYYQKNPQFKDSDDRLRGMPDLGQPGTATYDPLGSPMVDAAFTFLADIRHLSDGPSIAKERQGGTPDGFTKRLKGLAAHYGAVLTGVAVSEDSIYYTHRGRHDVNYGEPVDPTKHTYTFVFAVEMAEDMIHSAPQLPEALAVTKGYVDAAIVGMILTYYIKSLGYDARNHMDGNYLMVLPLAAQKAGLGDIGRHGLLINERFGPRVRLGAVTTDMPLLPDGSSDFNVQTFCDHCGKCIRTCPSKAIQDTTLEESLSGEPGYWQIKQEACYEKWRILGTDCGVCLSACPFSSGIPNELIEAYKNSGDFSGILAYHEERYPIRPFNKTKPEWLMD